LPLGVVRPAAARPATGTRRPLPIRGFLLLPGFYSLFTGFLSSQAFGLGNRVHGLFGLVYIIWLLSFFIEHRR
jgi:hypothetical protein